MFKSPPGPADFARFSVRAADLFKQSYLVQRRDAEHVGAAASDLPRVERASPTSGVWELTVRTPRCFSTVGPREIGDSSIRVRRILKNLTLALATSVNYFRRASLITYIHIILKRFEWKSRFIYLAFVSQQRGGGALCTLTNDLRASIVRTRYYFDVRYYSYASNIIMYVHARAAL